MTARNSIMTALKMARQRSGSSEVPADPFPTEAASGFVAGQEQHERIDEFIRLARADAATVDEITGLAAAPAAIARFLDERRLASDVMLAPVPEIQALEWSTAGITVSRQSLRSDGATVVTGSYAALADAGAVVVVSSAQHPVELNFLAATHIVVLRRIRVLESMEALWPLLRSEFPGATLPRYMNLIVGPSRTADLGVPPKLGAHGPGRVHILIVAE